MPSRATLGATLLLAAGYAAAYQVVSEVTAFGNSVGATFWPGAGLTLGVLLRRPSADWPWLLAGVFVAEFACDLSTFGAGVSAGWAVANTAEPLLAAWLLRERWRVAPDLADRRELGRFGLAAVVIGPLLGAVVGTAVGAILAGDPWWPRLPRWWIGDGIGVLVIAPLVLVARRAVALPSPSAGWPLVLLTAIVVAALGPWSTHPGLPFLVVPAMGFVAVQVRTPGVATAVLLTALFVETVTAAGRGPFAAEGAFQGLEFAQLFLVMTGGMAFVIAALVSDLVSRSDLERRLRLEALHDGLTGLANRRLLSDRFQHAVQRRSRHGGAIAVLFVDLDGFKAVNDLLGHAAGDSVLREAADRLREVVREDDTVSRLGGDEFVVLAEGLAGPQEGGALAERLRSALDMRIGGVRVGASVGVAVADPAASDLQALLDAADRDMYRVKQAGAWEDAAP